MEAIEFVDTTIRDGNQSLWALMLRTGMAVSIAKDLDQVGFKFLDVMAPAHFKTIVRELREDPWERLRRLSDIITETPLASMQQRSITGMGITPRCLLRLWIERIAANGIKRIHLMDSSNDMTQKVPEIISLAKEVGIQVAVALIYSFSPKHSDKYYEQKMQEITKLKVDAIYLKDPGGLLTPERIKTLIPIILQNANGIPVELHSHCTTGLAPLCYLETIKLGVKTVHTAIPPLVNASSQPSAINILKNIQILGYRSNIEEGAIKPIAEHLTSIAKREGLPVGMPLEYDYYQFIHQVPGGVISNLKRQLSQLKLEHRLEEVLEEAVQIRKDLGYPIMVTPFSQYVVSQATINVVVGKRYEQVIDELIHYALGYWGKEAATSIEPNTLDRIMCRPRAKELSSWEAPEPSIQEVRQKLGGTGVSDEEILLRYMIGSEKEITDMRAAGHFKEYPIVQNSIIPLMEGLVKKKDLHYVQIKKNDFSLTLKN